MGQMKAFLIVSSVSSFVLFATYEWLCWRPQNIKQRKSLAWVPKRRCGWIVGGFLKTIRGLLIVLSVADIQVLFYLFNFHFCKLVTYIWPPSCPPNFIRLTERDMYLPKSCHWDGSGALHLKYRKWTR